MFYSYRKSKKTSSKGIYILAFFMLIIIVWGILAYVGFNVESRIVTKDIEFLDKNIDLIN